jgi:hypothetical protein
MFMVTLLVAIEMDFGLGIRIGHVMGPTANQVTIPAVGEENTLYRYVSKLWSTHVLGAIAIACCVCCVCCMCCMCCHKLVVNRNWWCGASQMLASSLNGLSCVP